MAKTPWLIRPPSPLARARLFCLPYPGCGASMYHRWPRYAGTIEICPVQLPGRENRLREEHYRRYEDLAETMIAGLGQYLDRPFAFFGHCAGVLPAFEAAVRLCDGAGPVPARLFVSSQPAPHQGFTPRLASMDDAGLERELAELTRQLGGTPAPALLRIAVNVLRSDIESYKRYRRDRPSVLCCPITSIGWTDDKEVPASLMAAWDAYAATTHRTLPGEHYQFLQAPQELMDVITRDLAAEPDNHRQ